MFLYVCKQTFRKSKVRISQKVKGVIMRNLCKTIFIWRRMYCKIFISALVYLDHLFWRTSFIRCYFDTINLKQSGFCTIYSFKILALERNYENNLKNCESQWKKEKKRKEKKEQFSYIQCLCLCNVLLRNSVVLTRF